MRNLKRALSLGLTATMISGLMVMGAGAASYADVTSENHQEAIEVLKSVGIMTGDEKGNFNPEAKVTRNEMAVVMSNLMAYNVKTYANTSPFTDVPEWAEPYVAACYTNGITAGYTANTYGGSDNVTTAQAALMVMKALGYFQFQSDFGADWQLSTVAQGNKIDLFEDVDSPVKEAITRNELAQLVLNALESGTVEADDDTIKVNADGVTVEAGKVKYNFITSNKDYAEAISDKAPTSSTSSTVGAIVELGEKLYDGDLTKDRTGDDFGRPSNKWEYQAKEVGTYPDSADHTFTAKVTSKKLYDAIGKTAAENYDMNVYFNGEPVDKYGKGDLYKNKADDDSDFVAYKLKDGARTANGVITEVFVDGTDEVVTVAIMEQYAAEVLKVDEEDGTITLSGLSEGKVVDAKDEFETKAFAEDDIVIYTYANDKIQSVYAAEKLEGDVTSVRIKTDKNEDGKNTDPGDGDNFVVDGTTYKYNKTMAKADKLGTDNVNNGVVAYLDASGYVAYIDESAVTYDYAYVLSMGTDSDKYGKGSNDKGTTVYARLALSDGTLISVETDNKKAEIGTDVDNDGEFEAANSTTTNKYLLNHIVSYSKDKNNVYSLADRSGLAIQYAKNTALDINNDKASFKAAGSYTANAKTLFIVAESDPDSYNDYSFSVYTGVKNVPDIDGNDNTMAVVATKDGSNLAKVVYIEDADVSGTGDVIFVKADETPNYTKDQDGKVFEIDAIIGGEAKTLKVREGTSAAKALVTNITGANPYNIALGGGEYLVALKSITENADGFVTSVRSYTDDALTHRDTTGVFTGVGMDKSKDDLVTLYNAGTVNNTKAYTWDADVIVAHFDDKSNKGEFEKGKISDIKKDLNDEYLAVMDDGVIVALLTKYVEDDGKTEGPDFGVDGQELGKYTTIEEVNAALKKGNVVITGNWQPTDADTNKTITIPANTTLKIDGNFDANTKKLVVNATNSSSELVVTGEYDASAEYDVDYTVTAGTMTLRTGMSSKTINVNSNVTVKGDMTVNGNGTAVIAKGVTVTVGGDMNSDTNAKVIEVYGTLDVTGNVDAKVEIKVYSTNSLYVGGTMAGKLTIGDAKNAGKAVIGTQTGDVTVTNGTLYINKELNATNITGSKGAVITFAKGAELGTNSEGKFTNGTAHVNDVAGQSFTFDETKKGFINEDIKVASATAEVMFVYDEVTWAQAKKAGVPSNWMPTYDKSVETEPWIVIKAVRADGIDGSEITDLIVKVNGETVKIAGTNFKDGKTSFNNGTKYMGLNLVTPTNTEIHPDWLVDEKAEKGDKYDVSFEFNKETVTASGMYDGETVEAPEASSKP